jgi:hypothetical protein
MAQPPADYLEEHLPYELSMLTHTFERLHSTHSEADWNAFLESFCMHARNLKCFVTNDKGVNNSCVIARYFISNFDVSVPKKLTGAFQRVNEQTAHLTKNRRTKPAEKFTIDNAHDVYHWLIPTMQKFVDALSATDCQRWDAAAKKKLVMKIGDVVPSATNVIQMVTSTSVITGQFLKVKLTAK